MNKKTEKQLYTSQFKHDDEKNIEIKKSIVNSKLEEDIRIRDIKKCCNRLVAID